MASPSRRTSSGPKTGLRGNTLTGSGADVRFLDGVITVLPAAGTVLWTATRPTNTQEFGWAIFWMLLGLFGAVQGKGELRYGGFGVLSANAAYIALRIAGLAIPEPVKAGFTEAMRIATDGRGARAVAARRQAARAVTGGSRWGMRVG